MRAWYPAVTINVVCGLSKRSLALFFFLWWLIFATWALASPVFSVSDEPQHAFRAYSAVRGEIYVKPVAAEVGTGGYVNVPRSWVKPKQELICYAHNPDVAVDCAPPLSNDSTEVRTSSTAARYDPVYYLVVGLGSFVTGPQHSVWVMRLISAALSAAFMAMASTAFCTTARPRLGLAALSIATTPMVGFLAGGINPNGLEIAAAISAWVNGWLMLSNEDPRLRSIFTRRTVLSIAGFVLTRSLSPLWLVVMVAVLIVGLGTKAHLSELMRTSRRWTLVVIALAAGAAVWTLVSKSLLLNVNEHPTHLSLWTRIQVTSGADRLYQFLPGTVGNFGWLDTVLPKSTLALWCVGALGIVYWAMKVTSERIRLAVAMVVVASVGIPIVLEAHNLNMSGFVWQGRYTMPISVAPILIGGLVLASPTFASSQKRTEVIASLAIFAVALWTWLSCFVVWISRNTVGRHHALTLHGHWQPPVPPLLLVVLQGVGLAALVVVALRSRPGPQVHQSSTDQ